MNELREFGEIARMLCRIGILRDAGELGLGKLQLTGPIECLDGMQTCPSIERFELGDVSGQRQFRSEKLQRFRQAPQEQQIGFLEISCAATGQFRSSSAGITVSIGDEG